MKLTDEQIEVIAKECNFDMTGRLMRFARLLLGADEAKAVADEVAAKIDSLDKFVVALVAAAEEKSVVPDLLYPGGPTIDDMRTHLQAAIPADSSSVPVSQALPVAEDKA